MMTKRTKEIIATCAVLAAVLVAGTATCRPRGRAGFQSTVLTGGGGISKVTTNSPGLLAGSGTVASPLTATLSVSGIISGTGSSGSPLTATETGDISAVTAGSGIAGGGATGAVTLAVGAGSGILAAGSVTAVDVGTGITISSNHVTLNQTASTCTNGQAIVTETATGGSTCGSTVSNVYEGTHYEWVDEFMSNATLVNGNSWGSIYACNAATGGVCQHSVTAGYANGRPGMAEVGTGVTSNSTGRGGAISNASAIDFRVGNWTYELTGGWEVLSGASVGYTAVIGFVDTNSSPDQVDGCYFLYDERNAATGGQNSGNLQKLECVCAQNSTRTIYLLNGSGNSDESFALGTVTVGALAAPSTNILTLKIIMTGTTRAEFYSAGTKVCDINTNIPNGTGRVTGTGFNIIKSTTTTTSSLMEIDRTRLTLDMTSARSP